MSMPIAQSAEPEDPTEIRAKLRLMTDAQLVAHGRALKEACDPFAGFVAPGILLELREARLEFLRRRQESRKR